MKTKFVSFVQILLIFCIVLSCKQRSQEEVYEHISKSKELTELNQFCEQLPKPENISLIRKDSRFNGATYAIENWYKSNTLFVETNNFFKSYFEKNNWEIETFRNNDERGNGGIATYKNASKEVWVIYSTLGEFALTCKENK